MKTFTESLKITNNMVLLKETFICMSEKGIDPNKFVEWYVTDGIEDDKAAEQWLSDQLFLVEGRVRDWMNRNITPWAQKAGGMAGYGTGTLAGGAVDTTAGTYDAAKAGMQHFAGGAQQGWKSIMGEPKPTPEKPMEKPAETPEAPDPTMTTNPHIQHIKSAHEALNNLSLRMNKSKALKEKIGGEAFQSTIVRLMKMLKDMEKIPVSIPFEKPEDTSMPTAAAESHNYMFLNHIAKVKKQRQYTEISHKLKNLEQYGIDPEAFVEWYAEEGRLLNENWWDAASDFGGNLWANAKDAWQNRGKGLNHVWNNWGQAGQDRQARVDGERDTNAVQNAVKALGELEKEMGHNVPGDFLELLTKVHDKLSKTEVTPEVTPEAVPTEPSTPSATPADTPADTTTTSDTTGTPTQEITPVQQEIPPTSEVPTPVQQPELALSSNFWNTGEFKPQRDRLVQQLVNMDFTKNDGTKIKDAPMPSRVIRDIVLDNKTDMYTDPSGHSLTDFLKQWRPEMSHESVKRMPSFYEYMARRSL